MAYHTVLLVAVLLVVGKTAVLLVVLLVVCKTAGVAVLWSAMMRNLWKAGA